MTRVPAQIVVAVVPMESLAVSNGFTVSVTVLEVAGDPVVQFSELDTMQYTWSPFEKCVLDNTAVSFC